VKDPRSTETIGRNADKKRNSLLKVSTGLTLFTGTGGQPMGDRTTT
jgi:hypothetical protein